MVAISLRNASAPASSAYSNFCKRSAFSKRNSSKYSVELDKALTEYAELKAQAADFDPVELYKARQVIRPAQEKAAEQQLEDAMHEKPSLIMLLSAKQETSHLLGADAEERQARQLIMHRNQEQYRNSLSKRKRNDPER